MLIAQHTFYIEQARKRLLLQFDDMEAEAEKAAEHWLEKNSSRFDPDRDDPASYYERAHDESVNFYMLLSEMRDQTRLSVVAGMFHEWDKRLRDWLVQEMNHWHRGRNASQKIWSVDFLALTELFVCLNWHFESQAFYQTLDACRLVVNVYKHGEGKSLEDLKQRFPEFLEDPFLGAGGGFSDAAHRDHTHLKVDEIQIAKFSDAIIAFWNAIPENTFSSQTGEVPPWFEKALKRDSGG